MFDGELFGRQVVEIVRGYMDAKLAPLEADNAALRARIARLEERSVVVPERGEQGEQGPQGEPGTVDMIAVKALVDEAVAALPAPEAGKDGAAGEPGAKGDPGAAGADGIGLADALIDKDGSLVLTMTDGRTKSLGVVIGKDGAPGRDGVDGKDGKDGHTFTLDDFDIVPIDERTIKMGFTYGDTMHSFELAMPAIIYRGVWREGEAYQRGDVVTWSGSMWHCDKDGSISKPDAGDYTLSVKRGRDGRDAK